MGWVPPNRFGEILAQPPENLKATRGGGGGGLSDHVWTLEEIVMMADSYKPKPAKRGPYKKQLR